MDLAPVVVQWVAAVEIPMNEPRQEVSHLAIAISYDDKFADYPHQIIPTEDTFTLLYLPRQNVEGFNQGYLLPAEVTAF